MKAAVIRSHGDRRNVRVENLPRPEIEDPTDVVVRVRACALNRLDVFVREGLSGPGVRSAELPHVSGADVAGEVVDVGGEAQRWKAGDRVVVYPGLSCGWCGPCERGEDTMCREYRIFGEDVWGGLAEYCRVPSRNLEPLPGGISFEKAAALPVAYTTAWRMVVTAGRLLPNERVLVLGASGGVGTAAIQTSKTLGARVLGVTSGAEKAERLQEIGVDRAIDRHTEDFEAVALEETRGAGVEVVVNPVGGSTWRPAIRSLAMGGRMLVCGATIGDDPEMSIRELYQSHRQVLGAPLGNRRDFRAALDSLARGNLDPLVHASLSLEETSEAHRLVEEGEAFGKVIVVP